METSRSKTIFAVLLITFAASVLYSSGEPASWKYFKLNAKQGDEYFMKIKTELGIQDNSDSYELIVNISDKIAQNQYIEYISSTPVKKRFSWYDLNEETGNSLLNYSGNNKENIGSGDAAAGEYFRILVYSKDDPVFVKIQKELIPGESPLDSYTLVVNLSKTNPVYHYVAFGNDQLPSTKKYLWADLSMEVQKKLAEWNGGNKEKIE
jgi:hypothetical protein